METETDNELIDAFYVSQGGKPSMKEDLWFYSSDWNMLMGVVEKINSIDGYSAINIDTDQVFVHRKGTTMLNFMNAIEGSKISAVYKAVLEFIKWYNNQKENGNRNS